MVYIPSGSIRSIVSHLAQKGYDLSGMDSLVLRMMGSPQQGWITIGSDLVRRGDFLYRLTTAKAAMAEVKLIPGETTPLVLDAISRSMALPRQPLETYYESHALFADGVLVPESYHIPIGADAHFTMEYLLRVSMKWHEAWAEHYYGRFEPREWFRIVTIASVVEKEAANREEMPLVASVIYNRLAKGMRLQMDGTLNYGIYAHQKVTPDRIRRDKSAFNTYKYRGLPPYPVCIVSHDAIEAAVHPAQTDYLYFVRGASGAHTFSKSYSDHLDNIKNVNNRNN